MKIFKINIITDKHLASIIEASIAAAWRRGFDKGKREIVSKIIQKRRERTDGNLRNKKM